MHHPNKTLHAPPRDRITEANYTLPHTGDPNKLTQARSGPGNDPLQLTDTTALLELGATDLVAQAATEPTIAAATVRESNQPDQA
jgi:hypothetical protein